MRYYHLQPVSGSRLPRPPHSLILKPQVPKQLYVDGNGIIEDDFTPRVCLGETVNDCIAGLVVPMTYYHLYRTIGNVSIEYPTTAGPSTPHMEYGPDFVLSEWIDYQAKKHPDISFGGVYAPSHLPSPFKEEFEFCVPDVGETHELWSLDPVKVEYLGVLDTHNKSIAAPEETSQNAVPRAAAAALRKLIASDYRMQHKAPGKAGAPLYDLTVNDVYPKDVYQTLHQYKDHNPGDDYSLAAIRKYKGKPDASVMIYRAVPKGVTTINPGDFVTLAKEYAKNHAYKLEDDGSNGVVIKMTVKANQLYTDGNSINEWGYNP